jgi:glycosyltransferase involved in cell wall biosynthesis
MRILLFQFTILGGLGGVEVAVLRLAEEFTKAGHCSGILELGSGWRPQRIVPGNIPVWEITASSYPTLRRPRSWASLARTTAQFARVVHQFKPDIVHVHYPAGQSIPVVAAHVLPHRWRLVVTVHNSDIRVAPFAEPEVRPWQAGVLERADAVTAVSYSLLDDMVRLYPATSSKATVIWNGVSPLWFQEPAIGEEKGTERYLLFVGRLHHVKGVDLLLRAWQQIGSRFPAIHLWIVGDGPELGNLRSLASELGVAASVRFVGQKQQEELPVFYRNAEAVVLPSRREGLPFTLLEAAACGALCIGTRIPGIPEIIQDGQTGFIVEPEAPEALARTIARVLELAPEDAHRIKKAARSDALQRFSEETMISNYLRLFENVLGRPAHKPAGSPGSTALGKG